MKIPVELMLSKYQGGSRGMGWTLRVTDANARVRLIEVDLTPEQFSELIGGTVSGALVGVLPNKEGLSKIGMRRQNATMMVPIDGLNDFESRGEKLLARAEEQVKEEGEGWKVMYPDSVKKWNHHRVTGRHYSVEICRYVED